MNALIDIRPSAFRQFGTETGSFHLIVDDDVADRFTVDHTGFAGKAEILGVRPGADLAGLIGELPEDAAVLVAATKLFVRSTEIAAAGDRRIAVLPCGSTPVSFDHLRYFLEVTARTDPAAQVAFADRFFERVSASGGAAGVSASGGAAGVSASGGAAGMLRLVDDTHRADCVFDPSDESYEWNQQAGVLGPGEQQIAPAGELSVLPMDIMDYDPDRRLALNGTLALRGEPIVHAGYDPGLAERQDDLYRRLTDLRRHPVLLDVVDGVIVRCRPGSGSPEALRVAAVLENLFRFDPRYRTVWELGFGINTAMTVVAANCGLNEVYGSDNGVVHLGLGLTPHTTFALTFLCPSTRVVAGGETLLGDAPKIRRLNRTRDPGCGCH